MLRLARAEGIGGAAPLQAVTLTGARGRTVSVRDGAGREYARLASGGDDVTWTVGGALGTHTAEVLDVEDGTFGAGVRFKET